MLWKEAARRDAIVDAGLSLRRSRPKEPSTLNCTAPVRRWSRERHDLKRFPWSQADVVLTHRRARNGFMTWLRASGRKDTSEKARQKRLRSWRDARRTGG